MLSNIVLTVHKKLRMLRFYFVLGAIAAQTIADLNSLGFVVSFVGTRLNNSTPIA